MIIYFLWCVISPATGQHKQDYVWLFGRDYDPFSEGIESYMFDFNKGSSPDSIRGLLPIEFSQANASICDENGNLLLYSNGCDIAGADHAVLENGEGINDSDWLDENRNGVCDTYPGLQDILFLKDPSNSQNYYLIHKTNLNIQEKRSRILKYSYIDRKINPIEPEVTEKSVPFFDSIPVMYNYLTAINHENGIDWWIIQPIENSNLFEIFQLDSNGISHFSTEVTPFQFHWNASGSGTSRFSPDGTKYAYFNDDDNLLLFDFDRSTGLLDNLKLATLTNGNQSGVFTSIEWSSDSRFLYASITTELWQVDTWEENLEDGLELIDVWDGTQDPFSTTFVLSALAPDCKIYITPGSSSNTYHVINKPNEKGQACDFVQRGIKLPFTSARSTLPNFPRFRVDEADKCDPTITSIFGDQVYYRRDLSVYPNPIIDFVNIEIPDNQSGKLFLFDLNGQLIWKGSGLRSEIRQLDFSFLESGMYNLEFIPDKNPERLIWTKQLVKH